MPAEALRQNLPVPFEPSVGEAVPSGSIEAGQELEGPVAELHRLMADRLGARTPAAEVAEAPVIPLDERFVQLASRALGAVALLAALVAIFVVFLQS